MNIFVVLVVILFATAVVDLIVGVSNDAVNFLNSAIGSRVASFKIILLVASLGILVGASFSNGMMEIARNGLFNPSYFSFQDVIYIFLAVMLTDIILLDFYNYFGLPTSTTVSLVFELLGAAFTIGILVTLAHGIDWFHIPFNDILNFSSAFTIVSGIFLSIFLAFLVGTISQYISRMVFSFSLEESVKKFGAVFSGLAITTITYFLLIKGIKGSSFVNDEQVKWVMDNAWTINLVSLVFWSILVQVLMWVTNINPLRIVVLLGTFALAMAFAGNDLVNFIGVAVGGYIAFQAWSASGQAADLFDMDVLSGKFATPTWILLGAGAVMIITLWTSAKGRKVTETEVNLGRQEDGEEKFKSTKASRLLVGSSIFIGGLLARLIPKKWSVIISQRFKKAKEGVDDKASFDLIRAAVNLIASSVLIAFGTSKKLPLSTTFVTFMVAMGTSFADQAWGRESAVYRVAGVLKVVTGWFGTALIAFSASALTSLIIYKTGTVGIFVLVGLTIFLLVRSHILFRMSEKVGASDNAIFSNELKSLAQAVQESGLEIAKTLRLAGKSFSTTIDELENGRKNVLKKALRVGERLERRNNKIQFKIIKYVRNMPEGNIAVSRLYLLSFNHVRSVHQSQQAIRIQSINHVKNFHSNASNDYFKEIRHVGAMLDHYVGLVCLEIEGNNFEKNLEVVSQYESLSLHISQTVDRVIIEIQKGEFGNRVSQLQINLLLEARKTLLLVKNIYLLFYKYHKESK